MAYIGGSCLGPSSLVLWRCQSISAPPPASSESHDFSGPPSWGRDKPEPKQVIAQPLPWEQRPPHPWEQPSRGHLHLKNNRPGGPSPNRPHQQQRGVRGVGPKGRRGSGVEVHIIIPVPEHHPLRGTCGTMLSSSLVSPPPQSRGFPGLMRGGPLKRPFHGEHPMLHQAPPPRRAPPPHRAPPPDHCPGLKRRSGSGAEQISSSEMQHFSPLEHSPHPRSHFPPPKQGYRGGSSWTPPDRKNGPADFQVVPIVSDSFMPGMGGFGYRSIQGPPSWPPARPPTHNPVGTSRNRSLPSPANHTSVPYSHAPYRTRPSVPHCHAPEGQRQQGKQDKHMLDAVGCGGGLDSQVLKQQQLNRLGEREGPRTPLDSSPSKTPSRPLPESSCHGNSPKRGTDQIHQQESPSPQALTPSPAPALGHRCTPSSGVQRSGPTPKPTSPSPRLSLQQNTKRHRTDGVAEERGKVGEEKGRERKQKEREQERQREGIERKEDHSKGQKEKRPEPHFSVCSAPTAAALSVIGQEEERRGRGNWLDPCSGTDPLKSHPHSTSNTPLPRPRPLGSPRAPELLPVSKPLCRDDPPASPPLLSRQGSPEPHCSEEEEEEEELGKRRPDPRHSPTPTLPQSLPLTAERHLDGQSDAAGGSRNPTPALPLRSDVSSVLKSLASVLQRQRHTHRGGPFSRAPPTAKVKHSSPSLVDSERGKKEPCTLPNPSDRVRKEGVEPERKREEEDGGKKRSMTTSAREERPSSSSSPLRVRCEVLLTRHDIPTGMVDRKDGGSRQRVKEKEKEREREKERRKRQRQREKEEDRKREKERRRRDREKDGKRERDRERHKKEGEKKHDRERKSSERERKRKGVEREGACSSSSSSAPSAGGRQVLGALALQGGEIRGVRERERGLALSPERKRRKEEQTPPAITTTAVTSMPTVTTTTPSMTAAALATITMATTPMAATTLASIITAAAPMTTATTVTITMDTITTKSTSTATVSTVTASTGTVSMASSSMATATDMGTASTAAVTKTSASTATTTTTMAAPTTITSVRHHTLGMAEFLKLKGLAHGPPRELKIRLIKVESGAAKAFIRHEEEEEEKRIPLGEISIKNTAAEVIQACRNFILLRNFTLHCDGQSHCARCRPCL
ncbi:hypothetical protein JZ751_004552 [Albula glossodonta]|uniref:Uncharacterized protein n=1 Tax=Albula glossodonta TaxID=121402 RepID=A0A8T2N535_9TELE|nr:hypothetical protein JZ751_004552 [Albula glossodonta]